MVPHAPRNVNLAWHFVTAQPAIYARVGVFAVE